MMNKSLDEPPGVRPETGLSHMCSMERGRHYKPGEALKNCMWSFYKAADYSGQLSKNPKLFMEILSGK